MLLYQWSMDAMRTALGVAPRRLAACEQLLATGCVGQALNEGQGNAQDKMDARCEARVEHHAEAHAPHEAGLPQPAAADLQLVSYTGATAVQPCSWDSPLVQQLLAGMPTGPVDLGAAYLKSLDSWYNHFLPHRCASTVPARLARTPLLRSVVVSLQSDRADAVVGSFAAPLSPRVSVASSASRPHADALVWITRRATCAPCKESALTTIEACHPACNCVCVFAMRISGCGAYLRRDCALWRPHSVKPPTGCMQCSCLDRTEVRFSHLADTQVKGPDVSSSSLDGLCTPAQQRVHCSSARHWLGSQAGLLLLDCEAPHLASDADAGSRVEASSEVALVANQVRSTLRALTMFEHRPVGV